MGIYIGKSRNGLGLFSDTYYPKGSEVLEISGTLVSTNDIENTDIGSSFVANAFRYSIDSYISPDGENDIGKYLNHSCQPNVYIQKNNNILYLCAVENINQNNEIVLDYSTILANDDERIMECNCGEATCRKIISKRSTLPHEIQKIYIEENIIPDYILSIH